MNMRLTEEEKKEILSKYNDDTSEELLNYLKRHFPVSEFEFFQGNKYKAIKIDDKLRPVFHNKKYLVGLIYQMIGDDWTFLGEKIIRRTIKKYLDGIMAS